MDPIAFRRRTSTSPTTAGSASLNAVVTAANWQPRVANSIKQTGDIVTGRGFGFGTPRHRRLRVGAVAEIEVNKKTGKITVTHIYGAVGRRPGGQPGR